MKLYLAGINLETSLPLDIRFLIVEPDGYSPIFLLYSFSPILLIKLTWSLGFILSIALRYFKAKVLLGLLKFSVKIRLSVLSSKASKAAFL